MPDITDRDDKEKAYARLMAKLLKAYGGRLLEKLGDPPDLANLPADFWDEEAKTLVQALSPFGEKVYLDAAKELMKQTRIDVNWDVINRNASGWARTYTFELVKGLNDTTRDTTAMELERLRAAIPEFFERQMTRGDLEQRLQENGLFGPVRAEMIAVTEVTRAAARGEEALSDELEKLSGVKMIVTWGTDNDELVCEICEPLNGRESAGRNAKNEEYWIHPDSGDEVIIPAHPRCRCAENYELPRPE